MSKELAARNAGLYGGLGYFWDTLFTDDDLLTSLATSADGLSAQMHSFFNDLAKSASAADVPVYTSYRWRLLIIRDVDENKGDRLKVKVNNGSPIALGAQTSAPYVDNYMPFIGGYIPLAGYTGYPCSGIDGSCGAIVDQIMNPDHVLIAGSDFIIIDDTILFKDGRDPFSTGFSTRLVRTGAEEYREAALWCRDAEVDSNAIYTFFGHIFGKAQQSSDYYRDYTKSILDLARSGGAEEAIRKHVYTTLDIPRTESTETIEYVGDLKGGYGVITDKNVYHIPDLASTDHEVGDVLVPGTAITNYAEVTAAIDSTDASALYRIYDDIAIRGYRGVSVSNEDSEITYIGDDTNGNPKLRFQVYGLPEEVNAFWAGVDQYTAEKAISQETLFGAELYDYRPRTTGASWGIVNPANYMDRNYSNNNVRFVTVDISNLSENGLTGLYRLGSCAIYLPIEIFATVKKSTSDEAGLEKSTDSLSDYVLSPVSDTMRIASDSLLVSLVPACKGV